MVQVKIEFDGELPDSAPFEDAFPFTIEPNYLPSTERFDFEGVDRQYTEMIVWATERFGPARSDGLAAARWMHRVSHFRFRDADHAIEFKLRWA